MSEHDEQAALVEWFKLQYPGFEKCLIAIPNGSFLAGSKISRAKQMNKLKREGLKPGTSDLFLAVPNLGYHGLWLEMKDKGKTASSLTGEQKEHLSLMQSFNYAVAWAPGFEAAKSITKEYMTGL